MTTVDKTKDKLVDSMRKSKASGSTRTTTKRPAAKSTNTTSNKPMANSRAKKNKINDGFQSSGRVWPD
jgi:hypothetical protein